jgi:hypothetical protein
MPNKKISELTTVASPLSADYIPVVEDGVTKKATLASLPLSDAEVTALALKAPLASPTFTGTASIPTLALTNDLAVTEGGTGASTAADARTNLGVAYGPAFSAYKAANQTGVSDLTPTKVTFTTESFDTASAYDAPNSKFTPLVAGYYQVNLGVMMTSTTTTHALIALLYKNGALVASGGVSKPTASMLASSVCSALVYMNGSTDYLEGYATGDCGGAFDLFGQEGSTHFQAALVRPS